jgi:acetyl-CoA carboxylase biotin carboxyl carrier protein
MNIATIEQYMELMRRQGFNHLRVESADGKIELTMMPSSTGAGSFPAVMSSQFMVPPQLAPVAPVAGSAASVPPPPPGASGKGEASGGAHKGFLSGHVIKSPFVGTFYRQASPGADSFVEIGAKVRKGQTLCIVEAMKLMNEIESDRDGVLKEILVENGQPVEFDQPLFVIE